MRRAANEPSSRRDERKNYVETSEKATQPEPEIKPEPEVKLEPDMKQEPEPFTIRGYFGIGD